MKNKVFNERPDLTRKECMAIIKIVKGVCERNADLINEYERNDGIYRLAGHCGNDDPLSAFRTIDTLLSLSGHDSVFGSLLGILEPEIKKAEIYIKQNQNVQCIVEANRTWVKYCDWIENLEVNWSALDRGITELNECYNLNVFTSEELERLKKIVNKK